MKVVVHFNPALERLGDYLDYHEHHVRGTTGMTWRARLTRALQVRLHRRFRSRSCFQCQLREFYVAQIAELKAALGIPNDEGAAVTDFAKGNLYVPATGLVQLHEGEEILTSQQQDDSES